MLLASIRLGLTVTQFVLNGRSSPIPSETAVKPKSMSVALLHSSLLYNDHMKSVWGRPDVSRCVCTSLGITTFASNNRHRISAPFIPPFYLHHLMYKF